MEENSKSVRHIIEIDNCWIVKGDQIRLHSKGTQKNLPVINKKYEEVLKKLNISYRTVLLAKNKEGCEYWDCRKYETKKVCLPAYMFVMDRYCFLENRIGEIPTEETLKAAYELSEIVNKELEVIKFQEKVTLIREILDGRTCVYVNKLKFKGNLQEGEIKTENDNFYVFIIKKLDGKETTHIIIFDLNKIYNQDVEIQLQREIIPYIIGKSGCNFRKFKYVLGIKEIKIIEVD